MKRSTYKLEAAHLDKLPGTHRASHRSTVALGNTATLHKCTVEDSLLLCKQNMEYADSTRGYCNRLMYSIQQDGSEPIEASFDATMAMLQQLRHELVAQMAHQDQQNESLRQRIIDLKKDRNAIQQLVLASARVCAGLEQELGRYAN